MIAGFGGLVGLLIGSFVNVVAYRVPLAKSIVRPRSACPACRAEIRSRDNIPVLSWLLLRGRCRDCGVTISVRYPIVEATTGALFAGAALVAGARWVLPAYWWFIGVVVALTITDLDFKRIPDRILRPGLAGGALLLAAGAIADGTAGGGGVEALTRAGLGGLAYFSFLFVLALLGPAGGLGFGDVKLGLLLGLFLAYRSWGVLWAGIMLAFLIGGAAGLVLMAARRADRKTAIPFGPALVAGALVALAFGPALVDWYAGLGG